MTSIPLKSNYLSSRYGVLTVFNTAAVCQLEFSKFAVYVTWSLSPCYSASPRKISLKSDNWLLSYGKNDI